jgi:SAM-dependent methyltransferase
LQGLEANGFEEVRYLLTDGYVRQMTEKSVRNADKVKAAESFFKPKKKDLMALADLLAENECYSVLDAGCGSGRFLLSLCDHMAHQARSKFGRPVQFKGIDTRFWDCPLPASRFPNCKFELNGVEAMAKAACMSKAKAVDDTDNWKKDRKAMHDKKFHTNIVDELKCAFINGSSVKFFNQRVGAEHVLMDGDIITFIKNK